MPRRAIDLLAGLKLKERMTTKRRRRSVVVAIPGKERKSGIDSSAKKKIKNLREIKISRPVINGGWEVGDLILSDHPGLTMPPPPPPPSEESLRPASPLLPEPPSPRSMLAGPPLQRSLPSIPPSPTSPFSVHRSLISVRPGSPSPTQFFAGTTPPRTPLPEIPLAVALNLRLSPSSLPKPPSRSLPKEQWPIRDYSLLETTPKALTARSCPEPLRRPPATPGSSSPSPIGPEQRKASTNTTFSLWPARELPSKPLNTRAFSNSPKQPRAKTHGGESPYWSPTSLEPEMEPSQWLARPPPRQGPRGEKPVFLSPPCPEARTKPSSSLTNPEPEMEPYPWVAPPPPRQGPRCEKPAILSPTWPEARTKPSPSPWVARPPPRQGPRGEQPVILSPPCPEAGTKPSSSLTNPEPEMVPSPWVARLPPRQGPRGEKPLSSSPTCPEARTEPSSSLTRPSHRRGPHFGEPPSSSTPYAEPKIEPSAWFMSPSSRRGLRAGESPTPSKTGSKPRADPSASLWYQTPCPIPESGPAPVFKQQKMGLPALHEKIEPRDESNCDLALASAKDKHTRQMAKGEQELGKLREKVRLYEDFFLAVEAGRFSLPIGGGGGQCEGRGRPKTLEELKQRLESQLRLMKAEEMARSSGWF